MKYAFDSGNQQNNGVVVTIDLCDQVNHGIDLQNSSHSIPSVWNGKFQVSLHLCDSMQ